MHIFGHLRGEISTPLRLPLWIWSPTPTSQTNLVILGHLVLLTRTTPGLSWKRLALSTSELIRSDTRIFAPKQNHSWSPINFWWQITKGWKAMTNYVLNRPKWRQPKTTTSGGLPSLTVISANLWGQWPSQYTYYSFHNLISMLLISTYYRKPIWLKAHSKCHPMTTWNFNWDWRCSPSNLQVHSELLLHFHFPKQGG